VCVYLDGDSLTDQMNQEHKPISFVLANQNPFDPCQWSANHFDGHVFTKTRMRVIPEGSGHQGLERVDFLKRDSSLEPRNHPSCGPHAVHGRVGGSVSGIRVGAVHDLPVPEEGLTRHARPRLSPTRGAVRFLPPCGPAGDGLELRYAHALQAASLQEAGNPITAVPDLDRGPNRSTRSP